MGLHFRLTASETNLSILFSFFAPLTFPSPFSLVSASLFVPEEERYFGRRSFRLWIGLIRSCEPLRTMKCFYPSHSAPGTHKWKVFVVFWVSSPLETLPSFMLILLTFSLRHEGLFLQLEAEWILSPPPSRGNKNNKLRIRVCEKSPVFRPQTLTLRASQVLDPHEVWMKCRRGLRNEKERSF